MEANIKKQIKEIIRAEAPEISFSVERQEVAGRGDYSSNIAFLLTKKDGRAPLKIAEDLAGRIFEKHQDIFYAIEVAPPGFLNFFLSAHFVAEAAQHLTISKKRKNLGRASVEFISANPTGPLHIGNARGGPIGDTIADLLTEAGYKTTREYFHNDAGAQVGKFADSLWYWYLRARKIPAELPENAYEGEYIKEIVGKASRAFLKDPKGKEKLAAFAFTRFYKENFSVLKKLGIRFDRITKESTLAKSKTKTVLAELKKKGLLVKKEGATWFSGKGGRESVVVKSDGTLVYFANDIAYHKEKFKNFDLVVDILGEGHEGHIPKLRAVADVFGFPNDRFKIVVHGQVNLLKDGKIVTMSKRRGNFVTAGEVLREVGKDAFRFFMLQYSPRSSMQFDLELAKERSKKNPVYYVQYAHARASSILKKARAPAHLNKIKWELLDTTPEFELLKEILSKQEVVEDTTEDLEVSRLTRASYELARAFTHFYETTPVLGKDKKIEYARLGLVQLSKKTLADLLRLMAISAPERM